MTAIAGLVENNTIWIGGDSAGVGGLSLVVRKDPKVFVNGGMIFGFTSSFRMGNLLHYSFKPPKKPKKIGVVSYMNTLFIDAVRKCFKTGGYSQVHSSQESGGAFLVGFGGKLFCIESDFQVGIPMAPYYAVGCGRDLILGSLHTTQGLNLSPKKRIRLALESAEEFSAGVCGPFLIKKLKYK